MKKQKPSFFERLTGAMTVPVDEEEGYVEDDYTTYDYRDEPTNNSLPANTDFSQSSANQQLAIDMLETTDNIIVRANVAGVPHSKIDISITPTSLTISAEHSEEIYRSGEGNFTYQELSWGSFTRHVDLPEEIEESEADASQSEGILTITLPKRNRYRETKLHVRKD